MSPLFVRMFKKEHRCPACKAREAQPKRRGFSLCQDHLNQAAEQWRCWSEQRRADGKCCYCPRRSFRGWLRCRLHREINRLRIRAWAKAHPEHAHQQWVKRKALIAQGFCGYCAEHRPLAPGNPSRCEVCVAKRWPFNRAA